MKENVLTMPDRSSMIENAQKVFKECFYDACKDFSQAELITAFTSQPSMIETKKAA